jgi:hypothetical protein
MIGRLDESQKIKWYNQLSTVLYAYNATRSQITGFSPHFLMFGRRPKLPVDYDFPTMMLEGTKVTRPGYVREVESCLREAYVLVDKLNRKEVDRQKRYYDRKCRAAVLEEGDLVITRKDHREGRKKLVDRWSSKIHRVIRRMGEDSPVYEVEDTETNRTRLLHRNKLLIVQMAKINGLEEKTGTPATEAEEDMLPNGIKEPSLAVSPDQTRAPEKRADLLPP